MIHLTARLRHVADLVPSCQSMADIGTDHAYLPLFLLEKGKVQWAIASDIHKGPLERARAHLKGQEKGENIELRLGGGLSPLETGEVDGAVMAGMGGLMMRDILEADFPKAQSLSWLVLQPQNHVAELKQYLAGHHFMIMQEDMVMEDRRLYEMMLVKPGAMKEISLLEGEIGAEICNFIGYSTPNQAAYDLLDDDVKNNEIAYPSDEVLDRCEFFQHLPKDINQLMQDLWVEIKTE